MKFFIRRIRTEKREQDSDYSILFNLYITILEGHTKIETDRGEYQDN